MRRNAEGEPILLVDDGTNAVVGSEWIYLDQVKYDGLHEITISGKALEIIFRRYLKEKGYTFKKIKADEGGKKR